MTELVTVARHTPGVEFDSIVDLTEHAIMRMLGVTGMQAFNGSSFMSFCLISFIFIPSYHLAIMVSDLIGVTYK